MATFTVTALTDDGAGSELTLREAIEQANASAGADDIVFAAGLSGRIALNGTALSITDDLTIDGDTGAFGSPDVTISGEGQSGVVTVSGAQVTMSDLGIVGGRAENGAGLAMDATSVVTLTDMLFAENEATGDAANQGGGAIYNDGGALTVQGSMLSENRATGDSGSGGHIFSTGDGAALTIAGTRLIDGEASRAGGAIEIGGGDVSIVGSSMTGNATGPAPGNGGALHVTVAGTVVIESSYVIGNTASSEGGGLWNNAGATMIVRDSVVRDNEARGDAADNGGGGIFNNGGTLEVTGSAVAGNVASGASGSGGNVMSTDGAVTLADVVVAQGTASRAGGGVEIVEGSLDVSNSYFDANETGASPGNGGAIHSTGAAEMTVRDSIFVRNGAAAEGGAIWNSATGTLLVSETLFRKNAAQGNDADQGGGAVFNNGGTVTIERSLFDGNDAMGDAGSGGHVLSVDGSVTVFGTIMADGSASRAGGAIEVIAGDLTIDGGEFRDNATGAAPGNGGAIHVTADARTEVVSSEFLGNTASAEGGALWNSATGTMTVENTLFRGNEAFGDDADQGGGAVFNVGGALSVRSSTFDANAATGASGSGGHLLSLDGEVNIDDVAFFDGSAARAGGAIEVVDGSLDVSDSFFAGNGAGAAPGNGGAIHSTGAADMTVLFSDFDFNVAANEGGAIWNSATGTLTVVASSFFGNDSPMGSALFSKGGEMVVTVGPDGEVSFFDANGGEGGTITATGDGPLLVEGALLDGGDLVLGSDGNDDLLGEETDDALSGRGGRDFIDGGAGDDILDGGDGRDILLGGDGFNVLTGGAGRDSFAFRIGDDGVSFITDFEEGDKIAFDDRFFGIGDGRVDVRDVTAAQARAAIRSEQFSYDRQTGEITIDVDGRGGAEGRVIAVVEGGMALGADDFLLF